MGYPMALNLRKKIGSDYTILICDVVPAALEKFQNETADAGPVKVVNTGYEAVQAAVRLLCSDINRASNVNVCCVPRIWLSLCCQVRQLYEACIWTIKQEYWPVSKKQS